MNTLKCNWSLILLYQLFKTFLIAVILPPFNVFCTQLLVSSFSQLFSYWHYFSLWYFHLFLWLCSASLFIFWLSLFAWWRLRDQLLWHHFTSNGFNGRLCRREIRVQGRPGRFGMRDSFHFQHLWWYFHQLWRNAWHVSDL